MVWLQYSDNIPNIIQNTALALLTVLIPLAIAVLEDTNRKRMSNKKRLLGGLDLHVILDYVFQIPKLLLWISLIFLPLFLWDISSSPLFRLLIIALPFIGIIFVSKTIFKGYLWVKGRVWDFRFSYLESLREYNDFENVWRSIWQTEIINREDINFPNPNDEQKFFSIFSKKIDELLQNGKE